MTIDPAGDPDLLARLLALEGRVLALEQHRPGSAEPGAAESEPGPSGAGMIRYSGEVSLHGEITWSIALDARAALDLPDEPRLAVLAALGHPARARVVRTLLAAGPTGTAELQEAAGLASTGQLYHHLRTLTHCGLVEQDGRGCYRVAPRRVVLASVLFAAAADAADQLTGGA